MRVPLGVNGRLSSREPGDGPLGAAAPAAFEIATALDGLVLLVPRSRPTPSACSSVTLACADGERTAPGGSWCLPQPNASNGRTARNPGRAIVPLALLAFLDVPNMPKHMIGAPAYHDFDAT